MHDSIRYLISMCGFACFGAYFIYEGRKARNRGTRRLARLFYVLAGVLVFTPLLFIIAKTFFTPNSI